MAVLSVFADSTALLLCASFASALRKISFQVSAPGANGVVHPFQKPVFTTGVLCSANAVLFIVIVILRRIRSGVAAWRHRSPYCQSPCSSPDIPFCPYQEVSKSDEFAPLRISDVLLLLIPSSAYFASLLLAGVGMLFIPASICFMVQASCIIFTALCSVVFLHRELNRLHIRGICAALVGVLVVSYAGLIYAKNQALPRHQAAAMASAAGEAGHLPPHATHLLLGVSLTLVSQVTQALQFVSEEKLLSNSTLHPVQVMGIEGLLSTLFSCIALAVASALPGADAGSAESWQDTLVQINRSKPLLILCASQFLGVAGSNYFGLRVSVRLGSVFRTVLLSLRTLLIWSGNLAVYHALGGGDIGERWDTEASPIQCAGFVLLLTGTVLYAQGSSAVIRDTKTIVSDIQDIWQVLSAHSSLDLSRADLQLSQAPSLQKPGTPPALPRPVPVPPPVDPDRVPRLCAAHSLSGPAGSGAWQPFLAAAPTDDAWVVDSAAGSVRHRRSFADELQSVVESGILDNTWGMRGSLSSRATPECLSVGLPSFTGSQPGSLSDQVTSNPSAAGQPSAVATPPRLGPALGSAQPSAAPGPPGVCLISRAVEALGDQRRFHEAVKTDVEREIKLRQRKATMTEPSIRGTLGAGTSWVVPPAAVDGKQHRGASSFQTPFVPQVLRSNTEMNLERQAEIALASGAENGLQPENEAVMQPWPMAQGREGSRHEQSNGMSRELDFEMLFKS